MSGDAARSSPSFRGASPGAGRGFSLIELVVVMGVVMILVGLALPSLQRSWWTGRSVAQLASVRHNAALIGQYAQVYRDLYPQPDARTSTEVVHFWYKPMVESGYFASPREADPLGTRRHGRVNIMLSECMAHPPERMVRGNTQPERERRPAPVRTGDVLEPSRKGLLALAKLESDRIQAYWCCVPGFPKGPVAFADGGASLEYWMDLLPNQRFEPDRNGIGRPVMTTWGGARGRDRQQ